MLCLNGESKYHYLQSEEDGNMQLVENYEQDDYEYIPPVPGEWRGGASDIEIERDWVTDSRPKVIYITNLIQILIIKFLSIVYFSMKANMVIFSRFGYKSKELYQEKMLSLISKIEM